MDQTNKYLSRKFLLTILGSIAWTVLLTFKLLPPEVYAYMSVFTLGLYFTGNVVQGIAIPKV
jgi:hypothetical protein